MPAKCEARREVREELHPRRLVLRPRLREPRIRDANVEIARTASRMTAARLIGCGLFGLFLSAGAAASATLPRARRKMQAVFIGRSVATGGSTQHACGAPPLERCRPRRPQPKRAAPLPCACSAMPRTLGKNWTLRVERSGRRGRQRSTGALHRPQNIVLTSQPPVLLAGRPQAELCRARSRLRPSASPSRISAFAPSLKPSFTAVFFALPSAALKTNAFVFSITSASTGTMSAPRVLFHADLRCSHTCRAAACRRRFGRSASTSIVRVASSSASAKRVTVASNVFPGSASSVTFTG